MTFTSWFIVFLIFFGTLFLIYGFSQLFPQKISSKRKKNKQKKIKPLGNAGVCPLCSSLLYEGEQLKSTLYPGKTDSICHIFGCPHCFPYPEQDITRICPVCRRKVFADNYLVARMFTKQNSKNHVHIIGCTECRKIIKNK